MTSTAQVWAWLEQVADPEIPVISIVDLGIVRDVVWKNRDACSAIGYDGKAPGTSAGDDNDHDNDNHHDGNLDEHRHRECVVTITPTYSGCPAMAVIAQSITDTLRAHGVSQVRLVSQLSPAWTTDAMSEAGKLALKAYGIAPPAQQTIDISGLHGVRRRAAPVFMVICPHCGSRDTVMRSQFGSTPCKALYSCLACSEPFDYFKCH